MQRRIALGLLGLLLLSSLWSAPAAQAAETGIAINPNSGPPGTQFQILVTGLLENDNFSIAIYALPQNVLKGVNEFTSDASGRLNVNYDSTGDEPGEYRAVVTYLARGNQVIAGNFTIVGSDGGNTRYFPETGFSVTAPFLAYWEGNGALAIYGFPLSDPFIQTLEDGKPYLVQYFERARFEYHPEAANTPYAVQLGQFGRRIHGGADPAATPLAGARYYPETGHNLSGGFRTFWETNGGLAQFGYPITEVVTETLGGKPYQVQYFERARFEYHPENVAPYDILLGQFGRQILAETTR